MIIQTINHINCLENFGELVELFEGIGVGGIRINLSKMPEDKIVETIGQIYEKLKNSSIKLYLDFPFPRAKPRILKTNINTDIEYKFIIRKNKEYLITIDRNIFNKNYNNNCILLDYRTKITSKIDEKIYYADGEGLFVVKDVYNKYIKVVAKNTFEGYIGRAILCGYPEINDYMDRIIKHINYENVNYIFSFVKNVNDLKSLRKNIKGAIIPKIETIEAINDIENIVNLSDKVLIARGDLALNVELSKYLSNVMEVVKACKNNKKIIFCTDILSCSTNRVIPFRSEIFDLFLINQCSCDEIVLSGTKSINMFTKNGNVDSELLSIIKSDTEMKIEIINNIVFRGGN